MLSSVFEYHTSLTSRSATFEEVVQVLKQLEVDEEREVSCRFEMNRPLCRHSFPTKRERISELEMHKQTALVELRGQYIARIIFN